MRDHREAGESAEEPVEVDLVQTPEGLVAVPREPIPTLTVDRVRAKLDAIRSGRLREI